MIQEVAIIVEAVRILADQRTVARIAQICSQSFLKCVGSGTHASLMIFSKYDFAAGILQRADSRQVWPII